MKSKERNSTSTWTNGRWEDQDKDLIRRIPAGNDTDSAWVVLQKNAQGTFHMVAGEEENSGEYLRELLIDKDKLGGVLRESQYLFERRRVIGPRRHKQFPYANCVDKD